MARVRELLFEELRVTRIVPTVSKEGQSGNTARCSVTDRRRRFRRELAGLVMGDEQTLIAEPVEGWRRTGHISRPGSMGSGGNHRRRRSRDLESSVPRVAQSS